MPDFKIGQVLYVLMDKSVAVVQVAEEVTRKTAGGETKTYYVSRTDSNTPQVLSEIPGTPYASIQELREVMLANATRAIDALLAQAETAAKNKFSS